MGNFIWFLCMSPGFLCLAQCIEHRNDSPAPWFIWTGAVGWIALVAVFSFCYEWLEERT